MPTPILYAAGPAHEALYQDLAATLKRHEDQLSAVEILAVVANMLGKIIAMQDQRKITAAHAMTIVARNIEAGNRQALEGLQHPVGNA